MSWPTSQDFNEAIQAPALCFQDAELRQGTAVVNKLGLPLPRSGNFADVYAVSAGGRKWAVKCFTRQIPGLAERYREISSYLARTPLPFLVEFKFLEQGIKVQGRWYPALKMDWVEGFALNDFVRAHTGEPPLLASLCQIWVRLAARLRETGLAHCDLQHGNVLLVPGAKAGNVSVRLVDYDGMWVPALELLKSIELGHPNYQHPQRQREGTWSQELDRFPHLVIYTALRALTAGGKALWDRFDNGDNLLFKQQDFEAPTRSPLFAELLRNPEVRPLAELLIQALRGPLDRVPLLESVANAPTAASASRRTAVTASPPAPVIPPAPPVRRPRRLAAGLVAASVAVVLAGLAGVMVLLGHGQGSGPGPEEALVARGSRDDDRWPTVVDTRPSRQATIRPTNPLEKSATTRRTARPETTARKDSPPEADPPRKDEPPPIKPKPNLRLDNILAMQLQQHGWARGGAAVPLVGNHEGFAFLSMLTGFFGGGEEVKITVESGNWQLVGRTAQHLGGGAVSLRGPERALFETEVQEVTWKPGDPSRPLLKRRDGFCFLSGVGGDFAGAGEEVGLFLAPDQQWYFHGRSVAGKPVRGMALVLRTKQTGGFRARIREHAWVAGNPPVKMIRRTEGFCVLAGVGGAFRGGGEEVKVYVGDDDYWYLGGRSGGPSLHARAVSFDLVSDATPPARVPSLEEQQKAQKLIRGLFQEDFTGTKPAERLALADKLLAQAGTTKDDPAGQYVLYREALDLTADAGDPLMACQIAALLARKYAVRGPDLKAAALARAAAVTDTSRATLLDATLTAVQEAVSVDQFATAAKLLGLAESAAAEVKDPERTAVVRAWKDRLGPLQKEYGAARAAEAALRRDPADATASRVVGKYRCFQEGDWSGGLALLARADDAKLRELARKDLARPVSPEQRVAIGDGWWELAEGQKEASPARTELLRRCRYWYRQAALDLTGLSKTKVDSRLALLARDPVLRLSVRFIPLALDKVATAASTRPMFNGLTTEALPLPKWGMQEVFAVPFQVADPQRGTVRNAIVLYSRRGVTSRRMPRSVRLPCGHTAAAIHLLGGISGWGFPTIRDHSVSLVVRLHYANGLIEDHPLVNGLHLVEFVGHTPVAGSRLVYQIGNKQVRYLKIEPRRATPIREIEFLKGKDDTSPIVLGVTIEKAVPGSGRD